MHSSIRLSGHKVSDFFHVIEQVKRKHKHTSPSIIDVRIALRMIGIRMPRKSISDESRKNIEWYNQHMRRK